MSGFLDKIIIFDPLDRKIIGIEDDIEVDRATKRADLIKLILALEPINGNLLQAPLSKKNYHYLSQIFDK